MMNKLISSMQSNLYKLEQVEYNALTVHSSTEAVEIALMLAQHPAPPMPVFPMDEKYLDAEALSNAIDDVFQSEFYAQNGATEGEGGANGGNGESAGLIDDFFNTKAGAAEAAPSITDTEAVATCTEWMKKYNVIVGASWGDLPFDLQQRWLEYSCDYHLKDDTNTMGEQGDAAGAADAGGISPADIPLGGSGGSD
jgi:hypothetical protein